MFYRVTIVKEKTNSKSIKMRAKSKSEVEKMIPQIKELLFPDEDTSALISAVSTGEVEAYSPRTKVPEYTITIIKPKGVDEERNFESPEDSFGWFEETLEAESKEEAKSKVLAKGCPYPDTDFDECNIYINEISITKLLEETEKSVLKRAENEYIRRFMKNMTVREYANIQKSTEKKERLRYEALKYILMTLTVSSAFDKSKIDLTRMTAQEYVDYIITISEIEDGLMLEKTLKSIEEKYKRG